MPIFYNSLDVTEVVCNGTFDTAAAACELRGTMPVQGGVKGPAAEAAARALATVLKVHPDIDLRTRSIKR